VRLATSERLGIEYVLANQTERISLVLAGYCLHDSFLLALLAGTLPTVYFVMDAAGRDTGSHANIPRHA